MGKLYIEYLEENNLYICSTCKTHLSSYNQLISKSFRGSGGKAYLFNKAINVNLGPKEERAMNSGLHVVCDLYCKGCNTIVGWRYEIAVEESQKYKEGKIILERTLLKKHFWTY